MPPDNQLNSDSDLESVISTKELRVKQRRNSTGPKYFCTIDGCKEFFKRLDHLDRHEYHHTGIKKHACIYEGCDKTYTIVTHLKRHLRCTHERTVAPTKNVACSIDTCDKMFQSVCNMQRHIREVHENPKIYHCSYCDEKFTQRLKMRRHEITKHTKEYPFNCAKCRKGFYQEWQYEKHAPVCKIYSCASCASQFDKWSLYMKHCKEQQHGRKHYKCEMCSRIFGRPGELQRHIDNKHVDDEKKMVYQCTAEGCTRFYAYERNLKQHQLTAHSGKRFECTIPDCERLFSSSQNLQNHMKREHNQAYSCLRTKKVLTSIGKQRRKRKDAGQAVMSNLAKFSGLVVDKTTDKLLRTREKLTLDNVGIILQDDHHEESAGEEESELECENNIKDSLAKVVETEASQNGEMQIEELLDIALQD